MQLEMALPVTEMETRGGSRTGVQLCTAAREKVKNTLIGGFKEITGKQRA